jgi:hypothetical protein
MANVPVNLRTLIAQHFAGMSIDQAVRQGPEVWLDAGVGEDVARKLFGEQAALEARRRANARGNAKKRRRDGALTVDNFVQP